jgi:tetratricopeptide repeat protein
VRLRLYSTLVTAFWIGTATRPVRAQRPCTLDADSLTTAGWTHYRANDLDAAESAFAAARSRCPSHRGAVIGLGYVALRRGALDSASARFSAALRSDSANTDALFGLGLTALRRDDRTTARQWFERVLTIDPTREDARELLARDPTRQPRAPLHLPDTVVAQARTVGDRFQVPAGAGWIPFYVKGVNIGAALPGRFPSEFPDSATYASWVSQIAAMGANAVRLYTIHPPVFYQALWQYNSSHPAAPLWLIQGVWTELPPAHDFADIAWNHEFITEGQHAADVVHGRADIPERPGHAAGQYTADVSGWTLAWLVGREWEPFAVVPYDSAHPGRRDWTGRYVRTTGASATERWIAGICDTLVAYETARYRHQRPVAYTNWPPLDPLPHPSEASVSEELALRRLGGERRDTLGEYENDRVSLDPSRLLATAAFRGGVFASYHVYPFYPDFILQEGGFETYLAALAAHHRGQPLLIAEYGVPASLGVAHIAPDGRHHGGHTEAETARLVAGMTRSVAHSGAAGGILFAWIDEWFKRTWNVAPLELPAERKPLWLDRMDAENAFGVLAMEPEPRLAGSRLAERLGAWRRLPPLYGGLLRAYADEAALHLLFEPDAARLPDSLLLGIDVIDSAAGGFHWPGRHGGPLPFGIEYLVVATPSAVRILAEPGANPLRVHPVPVLRPPERPLSTVAPPPGFFTGPVEEEYNLPMHRARPDDARFESQLTVTNRRRFGRDSVEYAAAGYDRGALPAGADPDGYWEVDSTSGAIEIRIPWGLIGIADPSSRSALSSASGASATFVPAPVPSIGIVVAATTPSGAWRHWPSPGEPGARFTWPTWDTPRWRARTRPTFDSVREVFRSLDTAREDP